MNFDKGWSRLEKLLLLWGALFMGFWAWVDGVDKLIEILSTPEHHQFERIAIYTIGFGPWLVAKIIKWVIDGFRG